MHSFCCEVNPVRAPGIIAADAGQQPVKLHRCRYPIFKKSVTCILLHPMHPDVRTRLSGCSENDGGEVLNYV
jgi:hypothetical protein